MAEAVKAPGARLPLPAASRSGPTDPAPGPGVSPPALRRPRLRRHHRRRGRRPRRGLPRDHLSLPRRQAGPARRGHGHHRPPRLRRRRRPVAEPWSRQLPSASERLEKMVEYSCRILARTRPIHAIIRGAADKEAFAAALGRRLLQERLPNQTERIRHYLGEDLRPGLSVAEAGERYCALASPELYHLLTRRARLDSRSAPGVAHPAPAHRTALRKPSAPAHTRWATPRTTGSCTSAASWTSTVTSGPSSTWTWPPYRGRDRASHDRRFDRRRSQAGRSPAAGRTTRRSVTMAVTRSAGVTSNAGLTARAPAGATDRPCQATTSSPLRSSISM